jgi:hypothetical protein
MSVLFEDWQLRSTNITQPKLRFDRASTVHPVEAQAAVPVGDQAAATAEAVAAAAEATTRHQFLTGVLAVARVEVLEAAPVEAAEVSTEAPLRTTQVNR